MKILVTNANIFTPSMMNDLTVGLPAVNLLDKFTYDSIYKERHLMEENENYRQIIAYVLIQHRETGRFMLSRRTDKQTEARLHNKYSIGIGGHIDHFPVNESNDVIYKAAVREIREETGFTNGTLAAQGIILTDVEPIDRVHVGVLFHFITRELIPHSEDGKHEHEWADCERLLEVYGRMESWSQIVFDSYISHI